MQSLVAENNTLRETNLENLRLIAANNQEANLGGSGGTLNSELMADLQERTDLLMTENSLLAEQKSFLTSELDNYQQNLAQKTHELLVISQINSNLGREVQSLVAKLSQAEKERDAAAGQAVNFSDIAARAEAEMETCRSQLRVSQRGKEELESALHEALTQVKDIKEKSDANLYSIVKRAKMAEDRVRELHLLLLQKTKELDAANDLCRKLKKEYQATRQDAEGMLQVMGGLEKQVAEFSSREAEVEKLARESMGRVDAATNAKEEATTREAFAAKELERLYEERKVLLRNHQREIDAAVGQARMQFDGELAIYENNLKEMAEQLTTVRTETEKSIRDGRAATNNYGRMMALHEEERKATESALRELTDKLHSAAVASEEEVGRRLEVQDLNKELRMTIDKLRSELTEYQVDLLQLKAQKDSEVESLRTSVREVQKDSWEKARKLSKKTKEYEDLKENMDSNVSHVERKYSNELENFKIQLRSAESRCKDYEDLMASHMSTNQAIMDQLKDKSSLLLTQSDSRLRDEMTQKNELSIRNKDLNDAVNELMGEKGLLVEVIDQAKSTIEQLQEELGDAKKLISDMSRNNVLGL